MLRNLLVPRFHSILPRFLSSEGPSRGPISDLEKLRSRLYYQSKKRGILENDIIIGGFAEEKLKTLDRKALDQYDKIINGEYMEWDLYYYCTGRKPPPEDLSKNPVFGQIREFVKNKERVK